MEPDSVAKEVVILLTDMVQYSKLTQHMRPSQIRDYITQYYKEFDAVLLEEQFQPVSIDPSAGDGSVIVFDKRPGGSVQELCTRALQAAIACNRAIDESRIPSTRMGLFLGEIIEARLGGRIHKFGSSFAVASRLEELCGYYDTQILMDREVARNQVREEQYLVAIGKVTPKNFSSPFNLFSILKPGVGKIPEDVDRTLLLDYIGIKNEAIDCFCGNLLTGMEPDFPKVRQQLTEARDLFYRMVGLRDLATERILEFIREFPVPEDDFKYTGIKVGQKHGNVLGFKLYHLSKQLMRAIDPDLYQALIADTDWEQFFQLEWCRKGEAIVTVGDPADGIYYIDTGIAEAFDAEGRLVATFSEGSIFGEMAYYNREKRRNATVVAQTDMVLRKVSNEDFEKLPVIKKLFRRLARRRVSEELPY